MTTLAALQQELAIVREKLAVFDAAIARFKDYRLAPDPRTERARQQDIRRLRSRLIHGFLPRLNAGPASLPHRSFTLAERAADPHYLPLWWLEHQIAKLTTGAATQEPTLAAALTTASAITLD